MRLALFARPRGARDKRKRKPRGSYSQKQSSQKQSSPKKVNLDGARKIELQTRALSNVGRGLNAVSNAVGEARITANYFGLRPRKRLGTREQVRSNLGIANSGLTAVGRTRRLFF